MINDGKIIKAKRNGKGELIIMDSEGSKYSLSENTQTGLIRFCCIDGPINVRPVCSNVVEFGCSDWVSKKGIRMG